MDYNNNDWYDIQQLLGWIYGLGLFFWLVLGIAWLWKTWQRWSDEGSWLAYLPILIPIAIAVLIYICISISKIIRSAKKNKENDTIR